jgi:mono/diheme cytochrome c family protein
MQRTGTRLRRVLTYGSLGGGGLLLLGAAFIWLYFPRSAPAFTQPIAPDPPRLQRGSYLVNHVAFCLNCHSERDWTRYSGPVIPASRGQGTWVTDPVLPAHSGNITPFGIGRWSDGEVVRAITAGVKNDGTALHPLMPYDTYARLSEEDVLSIVAYLRTLPAVASTVPPNKIGSLKQLLLVQVVGRMLPRPWRPPAPPRPGDEVAYGGYLVTVAECRYCHGRNLAGGRRYEIPGDPVAPKVIATNLTPDGETGIGSWTREVFVGVFKLGAGGVNGGAPVARGGKNTVMPWLQYAGMREEDLGAVYAYLRSLPAIHKPAAVKAARAM